jgi:hypothetical protein
MSDHSHINFRVLAALALLIAAVFMSKAALALAVVFEVWDWNLKRTANLTVKAPR